MARYKFDHTIMKRKRAKVYAHRFGSGWNGTDDTAVLQAAINSGAGEVFVDAQAGPWVVEPITLASNQVLRFHPEAQVLAKSGSFLGATDCMFVATNKSNVTIIGNGATWTMLRDEYDTERVFPNGLQCSGCTNLVVDNLTIEDCNGDGIYIGGALNSNVVLQRVTCDNNRRNGLALDKVDNVLVVDSYFKNTNGYSPETGIDIEPKDGSSQSTNITLRRCHTSGNARGGIYLNFNFLTSSSLPVSVTIDDCTSDGDGTGAIANVRGSLAFTTSNTNAPGGSVVVNDYVSTDCHRNAILLTNKPVAGPTVTFNRPTIVNPGRSSATAVAFRFESAGAVSNAIGVFRFYDSIVSDTRNVAPMAYWNFGTPAGAALTDILGDIAWTYNGDTTQYPLTTEQLQTWMEDYEAPAPP